MLEAILHQQEPHETFLMPLRVEKGHCLTEGDGIGFFYDRPQIWNADAKELISLGVFPGTHLEETTGHLRALRRGD